MARTSDLKDVGLAIIVLRSLQDWTQAELSRQSGVDKGQISKYENGDLRPSRRTMQRLVEAAGGDLAFFDRLIARCRGIRRELAELQGGRMAGAPEEVRGAAGLEEKIAGAVLEEVAPCVLELARPDRAAAPRAEDRAWAEERWARLEHLTAEDQSLFVDLLLGDERTWALAERLCRASQDATAGAPGEALRLAQLAVRFAEGIPGPESRRRRLRAWCERFVAHASGDPAGRSGSPRRLELKAPLLL